MEKTDKSQVTAPSSAVSLTEHSLAPSISSSWPSGALLFEWKTASKQSEHFFPKKTVNLMGICNVKMNDVYIYIYIYIHITCISYGFVHLKTHRVGE